MMRYLFLAALGFIICAPIGFVYTQIGWVPWADTYAALQGACFGFSGPYFLVWTAASYDILRRKSIWASPRVRYVSALWAGASLGLFVLAWRAVLSPEGLEHFHTDRFQRFLSGGVPESAWAPARVLMNKAHLLASCNVMAENLPQYASICAVLAIVGVFVYDSLGPQHDES